MNDYPIRLPWVGSRYEESRVLIMGESHYCALSDEFFIDLTLCTIEDARKEALGTSFFSNIKDSVLGNMSNKESSDDFWERFAFANFCQGAVIRENGKSLSRASPQMFKAGEQALPTILSLLKPRKVILLSKNAWKHTRNLPCITSHAAEPSIFCSDGKEAEIYFYASEPLGFAVSCIAICHPSSWRWSGQNANYWHFAIRNFLDRP
ncbi:hypothetical protein [Acetobacter senegalensis]|uniref:hypothetical protein n=1 Tax=Acetobacter senegalensis TaxID=446692 RepID=UPI002650816B|nr:hypothetical protein [Acetobacter senegalensis]MDN7351023.1 hypothetical protein [Acetobacter senegalensis]